MKKILLDSSFIISAVKKKIDIFENLQEYEILVPEQVYDEIFKITQSKQSLKNKHAAGLALKILEVESDKFKKINLGKGHTDNLIIKYALENKITVATIDQEIRKKLKGKILSIRQNKRIESF